MPELSSFQSICQQLNNRVFSIGINYSLDHFMTQLCRLGNPQHTLPPCIHIAGTNGKGSTLAMIASILSESGLTVGTYTSPHIECYTERIKIGTTAISQDNFVRLFNDVTSHTEPHTEFEILTAMAFLFFNEKKPDILVIETGLGGRLDATNVIMPILSVITPIDIDHQAILGESIADIAKEKAGIIKEGVPVLSALQVPEATDVLMKIAHLQHARIETIPPNDHLPSTTRRFASYQKQNIALAIAACVHINPSIDTQTIAIAIAKADIAGRFDIVQEHPFPVIIDGAHNRHAIRALISSLTTDYPDTSFDVVLSILKSKDPHSIIDPFKAHRMLLYYWAPDPHMFWDKADMSPSDAEYVQFISNIDQHLLQKATIFTGSLHMIRFAREALHRRML